MKECGKGDQPLTVPVLTERSYRGVNPGFATIYEVQLPEGNKWTVALCRLAPAAVLPKHTPWGQPDHIEHIAPGIVFFGTPSHGGIWLAPERLAQVPLAWREARFGQTVDSPWFEEDCDWCLAALTFPNEFPANTEGGMTAQQTFDAWIAPKIAKQELAQLERRVAVLDTAVERAPGAIIERLAQEARTLLNAAKGGTV